MSKRPLFIIFALFASVSISASIIPSNGADYIAIIAIKRAFPENQIARQISKLELKELELEELQTQLSKTGIQSEIKVSGFLEVINALNNDQLLVCEIIPTTDSSVSQMALIERQTDKFYIFSLFKYAKAQISPEELFTNFKNRLTNRFLIITPKIHRLGLTIENERQRSSENESITNDRRFSEWLHGDSLSIPSLINLGSVPTGGVLIPINIPIENKSKDAVRIFSTVTQCSCIKGSSCPPEIQEHAIGIFHLKLDPSIYIKEGIIDTSVGLNTADQKIPNVEIRIIGIIDNDKNLVADPARIFDIIKDDDIPKEYIVTLYGMGAESAKIDFFNLENDNPIFELKLMASKGKSYGKYRPCKDIVVTFLPSALKDKKTSGHIVFTLDYADALRTYSIPYTFIKQ